MLKRHPAYFRKTAERSDKTSALLPNLDVKKLIRSLLSISAEIEHESLMKKILNAAIQSSGARRGCLLLEEDGKLYVRAASDEWNIIGNTLEEAEDLCKTIIWYVYRTGEKVILEDAKSSGALKDSPEVQRLKLRSVLCLPIVKSSKIIGVLYLENSLSGSVFTAEKVQMIELLTEQVAISIQNACLVVEMKKEAQKLRQKTVSLEKRVQERTAELAKANSLLQKDIAQRERIEASLKSERQRLFNVLEMLPVYLLLLTPDYWVTFANKCFRDRYGVSYDKRCYEFIYGYSEPCANCQAHRVFENNEVVEWEWIGPDGAVWRAYDFPFTDSDGSRLILEMGIDITARKKADAQVQRLNAELERRVEERTAQLAVANRELHASEVHLRETLQEKETLLKEIHHRVKNNLQIIQSMLSLQMTQIKDPKVVQLFKESQNRVFSMALIHEKLYQSKKLTKIDFAEYIRSLTSNLFFSYGVTEEMIRLVIDVEDVTLEPATMVPCALIINELVSNSLKYAFVDSARLRDGTAQIVISLRRIGEGKLRLVVSDNGVGLPAGYNFSDSQSLGLKLVNVLTKQFGGNLQVNTICGTEFAITFDE